MPYIYVEDKLECQCLTSRPVAKPTTKYPCGSVWQCPKCESQWLKEKVHHTNVHTNVLTEETETASRWRKLMPQEMLVYNGVQWVPPA